jgi:hypothetical protein
MTAWRRVRTLRVSIDGHDNYASLAPITSRVHVYGLAGAALSAWCADHDVPLRVFDWRPKQMRPDWPAMLCTCLDQTPT